MHVEAYTNKENKITLTLIDHLDKKNIENVFTCPIRRPTNIPKCNLVAKTFINGLITKYIKDKETIDENQICINKYKKFKD